MRLARSVSEATRLASENTFDVVISDLGLPDGSGLELMRHLKQRYNLRGIALTGYGMEQDVLPSHDAGFDEHLTKPVDFNRLGEVITKVAAMSETEV